MTNRLSQQNDEITLNVDDAHDAANVRNAYWDLVYAIQAVEAAQNSFDLANGWCRTTSRASKSARWRRSTSSSAQAEAASRRQTLVQSQATVRTSELALKRLIVSGTEDPLWTSSINRSIGRRRRRSRSISRRAVARALSQRTDLQQSQEQPEDQRHQSAEPDRRDQAAAEPDRQLRPERRRRHPVQRQRSTDPLTGAGPCTHSVGYLDALRNIGGFDRRVDGRAELRVSARHRARRRRRSRARSCRSNRAGQPEGARAADCDRRDQRRADRPEQPRKRAGGAAARELAQKRLDAAQSKFEVGMATNYEVVQAQRDFADAQNNELRAVLNYRKALVNFETVQPSARAAARVTAADRNARAAVAHGGGRHRRHGRRTTGWQTAHRNDFEGRIRLDTS